MRRVLSDYDKEVVLLLSGTNTAHQAKAVLRMLTSFVMLGSSQARSARRAEDVMFNLST